ncbi:MAG TPA: ATP-binding protein [Candidatus Acidoferrales bacterium]|jgi:heavy metal sensor kinase|nr:ATP-binding protein [Candidatus Acidoferrales bacterium]
MSLTIRARLTALYFLVLAASFTGFFSICDFGFQRSIATAVNDASQRNLDTVRRVLERHASQKSAELGQELARVSDLWESGAIFEVAGPDGQWIYRAPRFLSAHPALEPLSAGALSFQTTNLEALQYRVARQQIVVDGNVYLVDAAVPTEPFDQALDSFRLTEKRFLPLLVVLASLLGYWLSGRALAPVNRIIEGAERVGVQNLSRRLEVPRAKDELRRLTEQVNAMLDRIEASVKRITQFTADASHDLRTPLALIRANAELALRRPRSEGEYREALGRILATSEETTELIEHLLMLARADANAAQLKLESTSLYPVLQRVAQKANMLALGKGLTFSESAVPCIHTLFANEAALQRLFMTVIDNAIKYTPSGGHVGLSLRLEDAQAIIEVADTGIGITENDLPHVFERFYRADQARSRETRGSGLGLSIAKWIAESHHGSIELLSQPGHGTKVTIRLPLFMETGNHPYNESKFREAPLKIA